MFQLRTEVANPLLAVTIAELRFMIVGGSFCFETGSRNLTDRHLRDRTHAIECVMINSQLGQVKHKFVQCRDHKPLCVCNIRETVKTRRNTREGKDGEC